MNKENRFTLGNIVAIIGALILLGLTARFCFVYKTKPVTRDTPAVSVIHDAHYYAQALIADHGVVSGLPSAEEIMAAVEDEENPKKLAELLLQTANAYAAFAGETKNARYAFFTYDKYAYYSHLTGTVYSVSLHDNETACWYYLGALRVDKDNPLYRESYSASACDQYRHK